MKKPLQFLIIIALLLPGLKLQAQLDRTMCVPPTLSLSGPSRICYGDSVALCANGATHYLWSTGATTSCITVSPAYTTTYTVVGWDTATCKDSLQKTVTVDVPTLTVCCDTTIHGGDSTHVNAYGSSTYSWVPTTGLSCNTCPDPVASPIVTTTYTVTGTDTNGCSISRTVTIFVIPAGVDDISSPVKLCSINPNPANNSANIHFTLNQSNNISLVLFNTLGQKVAKIENKKLDAGTYTYPVNLSVYSPGVYYLTLSTSAYSVVKKLVIVR